MELEEFVFQSITQIANGIQRAQADAQEKGYLVSPPYKDDFVVDPAKGRHVDHLEEVKFDIAVTSSESSNVGGKLKIVSFGMGGEKHFSDLNCSRIQFQVKVRWPRQA